MRIALVGAGACGSVFASYMRRGGAEMTLVDMYKEHMDKVRQSGMDFIIHRNTGDGYEDETIHLGGFETAYTADSIGVMDAVIFVTKATQLDAAVKSVRACIGENTVLCVLANGLGNDAVLAQNHPAELCLFGCGTIGTALKCPGVCVATPPASGTGLFVGPVKFSERAKEVGEYIASCFTDGGIQAEFYSPEEISKIVWRKAIHNSAANTTSATTRLSQGAVWADEHGRELQSRIIREGCAVAAGHGIVFDPEWFINDYFGKIMEHEYDLYPSMAQDLLMNKRQTEITVLNGAISRMGKQLGIDTPANDILTLLVETIQANYDKQLPVD